MNEELILQSSELSEGKNYLLISVVVQVNYFKRMHGEFKLDIEVMEIGVISSQEQIHCEL